MFFTRFFHVHQLTLTNACSWWNRFEQERGFKGADRTAARDGPVQFQREEDPFDLTNFFKDVRHGGSAPSANPSSSKRSNPDDREERSNEKRRKK
jgi:hypothetical protein